MIKVTFEFKTIEEAIATLGSLMKGAAPVPNVANPAKSAAETKTRKPRADAGKARGSYKNANADGGQKGALPVSAGGEGTVTDAGKAAEQAANPISTPLTSPLAPESAAPTSAAVAAEPAGAETPAAVPGSTAADPKDAEAALDALFKAKGLPAAQQLLTDFGVKRLRDLPAEKRGEFVQRAKEATK
jgi:hypothetical protein